MSRSTQNAADDEPIIQTVAEPLQQVLQEAAAIAAKKPDGDTKQKAQRSKTLPFRPTNRQPLAMLTILDDGSSDQGEQIRIRHSRITIGRERGDVLIPFDSDISAKHAELRCQQQRGRFRWYLVDKSSTNGTFLRAYRASLSRETELILGSRRYLFQLPDHHDEGQETEALQTQAYRAPSRAAMEQLLPRLVETGIDSKHPVSFSLGGSEAYVGSDHGLPIAIENDPFLNQKHARIYKNESGRWMIEDKKSLNGVWIRIKKLALDRRAEFQLGQQRFRFQPHVSDNR